ncbi:F-box protein at3g07870 [Phtheirospermum japonicum]|uniref:F-box protein at3g07870 n=1 Tax=Phtheirospermum japonicum TaxID=374723 RepID=A0A830AX42_9LAMI|nr:F-box protein at3g07870 [Phtheirospermum japonicum]
MSDYLCEEITTNILHRLPVNALLRCTSVCKSWYNLITTPQFISYHLNFAAARKNKNPFLLLRRCLGNSERYDVFSDNDSFTPHATLEFPFRSINPFFSIVGSCNGLVCLSDDRVYYTHTIILWNPCIKKSLILPKPDPIYNSSYGAFAQSLGFGFDPVASDYKVIRIISYADCRPRAGLYKLSTGAWQDLNFLGLECVVYNKSYQAYVNGATHWVARYVDFYDVIVFFDMCKEVFGKIMLPLSVVNNDNNRLRTKDLVVYNESLALILWNVSGPEPGFCIWVMKEYGVQESWTKHMSFDSRDFGERFMRPLWVRKRGEVITVWQDGRLVSYGPDGAEEVKDLGVDGSRSEDHRRRSIRVDSYMESLVLLDKGPSSDVLTSKKLPTLHM